MVPFFAQKDPNKSRISRRTSRNCISMFRRRSISGAALAIALITTGCSVLYPSAFKGTVAANDGRTGVPCTLSLHEALDGPTPIVVGVMDVTTGERFDKKIQLKGAERSRSKRFWVSYV